MEDVYATAGVRQLSGRAFPYVFFIRLVNGTITSVYCLDLPLVLAHVLAFACTLPLTSNPLSIWGPWVILGVLGVALFAAVNELP